jgi:TolB protein
MMKRLINSILVLFILLAGVLTACSSATETPPPLTSEPVEKADTPTPPPAPTSTPTPAAEAQPPAPSISGRIAFPVYDEAAGTYNLYLANADGSNRQLVAAAASQPDLNADGTRIVFRSWQGDKRGLIEQGVDGSPGWNFNNHFEAGRPKFAPDNMSFLFHSKEAGEKYAIYRTQNEGYDVLRRESNPIQGEAPGWTPGGQGFVYKGCMGTGCGLFFSNLDGSSPLQLTDNLSDTNGDVSPNGQTVVYMSEVGGNWDVWAVNVDGTDRHQLTTDPGLDGLPVWSPDGRTIAFVSDRGGQWAMWAMNADGGNQRQLFELGGSANGIVQLDRANSWGWLEESIAWAP